MGHTCSVLTGKSMETHWSGVFYFWNALQNRFFSVQISNSDVAWGSSVQQPLAKPLTFHGIQDERIIDWFLNCKTRVYWVSS